MQSVVKQGKVITKRQEALFTDFFPAMNGNPFIYQDQTAHCNQRFKGSVQKSKKSSQDLLAISRGIRMIFAFQQERLLDVKLAGEGGVVRAHRVVLAAASAYFEDLLADCTDHLPTIFFRSA